MQLVLKKLFIPLLLSLTCTFTVSGFADVFTDIANAIRSGEAKAITNFCGNTVNLTILNQEDVYSRAQAEQVLKSFFAKNTPRSFTIVHKGGSKEGSKYAIGSMVSSQGLKFRVYLLFKQTAGGETLQEIRFEKE
jgi:hypothetical protein